MEYQRVGDDRSLGLVAQVPPFLYNNQKARIAQTVAQEHGAETQLRQAEIQAVTDIQKAYQGYLAARQAIDLYTKDNLAQVAKLREIAEFSVVAIVAPSEPTRVIYAICWMIQTAELQL
jgi:cobalt-zinc-cadmium efflux system outer membrane protein